MRAFSRTNTETQTALPRLSCQVPREKEIAMFAASVIGGILLAGFCISRVKASREAKKSVQTLFDKEK
jgi:hypothetical protein